MRITIEGVRKTLATVVGATQTTIGALAVFVVFIINMESFGLRPWLYVDTKLLPLYTFVLLAFGFLSVINGLFVLGQGEESS